MPFSAFPELAGSSGYLYRQQYLTPKTIAVRKTLFFLPFLLFSALLVFGQKPFANEIRAFKRQDSLSSPPRKAFLFIGSSSFRMWNKLAEDFPKQKVINRGFGGSSLPHVIAYADDIIFPYKPRKVVIYCGENDLASGATGAQVVERFETLFNLIRERLPKVPVIFLSIKPSPSRLHLHGQMLEANSGIREFLATRRRATFVDVYSLMLDNQGQPRQDLFLNDNLHMNRSGYEIWKAALTPYMR